MSATKKKPPVTPRHKPEEEVNKRALIWIGSIVAVVIVAVAVLLILKV